jgi:anaerobic magnesium-protoporphyrin IX monomethyl ester cyclase
MRILFYYRGSEQLGVEILASILKQQGHDVGLIYDPGADNVFYFQLPIFKLLNIDKRLIKEAIEFKPDLIAFSCLTNLYPYVKSLATELKNHLDVPFIIGGVHPTTVPQKVMDDNIFDYLCVGEGDDALPELITALETGGDTTKIPNLWARVNGEVHRNAVRPLIQDLDSQPLPCKDLFYNSGAFYRSLLMMTSRGCPYKCSFCINNFYHQMRGEKEKFVRQKSVSYTIKEIHSYMKFRPTSIDFQDDIFGLNKSFMDEFADRYPKEIGLPFICNVHPLAVSQKHAQQLKKAGVAYAQMGVQSGDTDLRKWMHRTETNEQIEQSCRYLKEAGVKLNTEFIFGFPTETSEQMWESVKLINRINSDSTATFVFYPFPETEAYSQVDGLGLMDENQRKSVHEGLGSYHTTVMIDQPYAKEALNLASLVPLFNMLPDFFTDKLLKKMYRWNHGAFIRAIGLLSLPLLNPWQFKDRVFNFSHMLIRLIIRPKPRTQDSN